MFRGGLLYGLGRRVGLIGQDGRLFRLGLALAALTWLPLFVLSTLDGQVAAGTTVQFWQSIGTHVRLLVTLPLFFVAEDLFDLRVADVLRRILRTGLVPPADEQRFDEAVRRASQARDSRAMGAAIFALTIALVWFGVRTDLAPGLTTWRTTVNGDATLAGWWYALVSIPVFQFLLWRWVWRWLVWSTLLWRLSRLDLQLMPTHPDGAGGLAVLGVAHVALAPLAFGASAILASSYAEQMLFLGVPISAFAVPTVAAIAGPPLTVILPLTFFTPRLIDTRQRALLDYGDLAARYSREFAEKWLHQQPQPNEQLIGSADIQSLADMGGSFDLITRTMNVPMARRQLILLAAAAALPFAPLLLLHFPLDQLIIDSMRSVLGVR